MGTRTASERLSVLPGNCPTQLGYFTRD
ncbi:Protein of unknown function [Propionibacterium freudenreichii]|nr:Protein of unknown function [Propionibacterium freudenreichii]CEG90076.1 Protein of unknown function [Propionibacterium freudenreichii]CEG94381.1 Protein of unknown function [Propionibacterium freudenreichii]CEG96599.1 protein of unknow function [Propionibacterium freudenreichii]CEI24494.1 Protein of unknown function [Propionibacterium freudenreichii]